MKKCILIAALLLLVQLAFSDVHQVAEGSNGITAALTAAAPGDIIELTTSGGKYVEDSTLVLNFGVTIRAAAGLAEQPVLYTRAHDFFLITAEMGQADNWWLILEGITIDGMLIEGADTTLVAGQVVAVEDGATYHSIKVEGCTIQHLYDHDLGTGGWGNKFTWPPANSYTDSVIFRNNIVQHWSEMGGDILFFRHAVGGVGYVLVENCTIWDAGVFVLDVRQGTNEALGEDIAPEVMVRNLTISGSHQPWAGGHVDTKNGVVKNLIISNSAYGHMSGGQWQIFGEGTVLSHVLTDSVKSFGADNGAQIDSTTFWENVDPMFEDPLNGNFNLMKGSPAIGAADDGGNLGDPRWVVTAVEDKELATPSRFSLHQNYPNPFNPTTTIRFDVEKPGLVTLEVYNAIGQLVTTLVNANISAGSHTVTWNATTVESGIYFYRLTAGDNVKVRKMVLLK